MFDFSLSLNVILTSGKVPHEITPVHVVQLVDEEELDVIPLCRNLHHNHLSTLVVGNLTSFYSSQPVFVGLCMCIAVHTWEQHVLSVFILCFMTYNFVAVFFIRTFLFFPLVYRSTFFHIVHASSFSRFQCRFGSISLSVE